MQEYLAAKAEQARAPPARADPAADIIPGTGANIGGQLPFNFGTLDRKMIFVVNFSMPTYQPSMMSAKGDGETLTLVWYMLASDETQRDLLNASGPQIPAVRLLKRLAETDFDTKEGAAMMLRMKALPRLVNADDFDFGWALRKTIAQYNGKPFLTRPQHSVHRGDGYLEYCLDIHNFCYMARNVLYNFIPKMSQVILDWGFTIEGYEDDEQPEVILGSMRLFKVSPNNFPSWEASMAAFKEAREAAANGTAALPAAASMSALGTATAPAVTAASSLSQSASGAGLTGSMSASASSSSSSVSGNGLIITANPVAASASAPGATGVVSPAAALSPMSGSFASPSHHSSLAVPPSTAAAYMSPPYDSASNSAAAAGAGAGIDRPNFATGLRRSTTGPGDAAAAGSAASAPAAGSRGQDHVLRARTPSVLHAAPSPAAGTGGAAGGVSSAAVAAAASASAGDGSGAASPRASATQYYAAQSQYM